VKARLGRDIGQSDNGTLHWLCFYGSYTNGHWRLWLEGSALGNGRVDGFALKRVGNDAQFDSRCHMLRQEEGGFKLPIPLRLDMSEMEVRNLLGRPSVVSQVTT